jgi:hypothetical protein
MATAISGPLESPVWARERAKPDSVPWYLWCSVLAITSVTIGLHWDISWHRSIGRDTFWTPAHLAIQFCGILSGVVCGYLILHTTFAENSPFRDRAVRVMGFRGPLGAFMVAWGGMAMVFSAPFDNWWHGAYGLDVKILSPPHTVLALGIFAVAFGSLVLIAGQMNRAEGALRRQFEYIFLYVSGMVFVLMQVFIMEFLLVVAKHTSLPYRVLAITCPILLISSAYALDRRFVMTTIAGIYTAFILGLMAILPLFHAAPKLGPVFHPINYFVPPPFPPMVIVPALALDIVLLFGKAKSWNKWLIAFVCGIVFTGFMVASDWNMASFLLRTKLGQARFFQIGYLDYATPIDTFYSRKQFFPESPEHLWMGLGLATLFATLSARVGMARGLWLKRVVR